MPDNTVAIAEIDEKLREGVSQMSNDGTAVSWNLAGLRKERRALVANNTAAGAVQKRPAVFQADLGGF